MQRIPKDDLLHALKQSLHDLGNLKLLSPNDHEILDTRRRLKEQIAALEQCQTQRLGDQDQGERELTA